MDVRLKSRAAAMASTRRMVVVFTTVENILSKSTDEPPQHGAEANDGVLLAVEDAEEDELVDESGRGRRQERLVAVSVVVDELREAIEAGVVALSAPGGGQVGYQRSGTLDYRNATRDDADRRLDYGAVQQC